MFFYSITVIIACLAPASALLPTSLSPVESSLLQRELGEYLGRNGSPQWGGNKPWGSRTCTSNPSDVPNTGVTRHYSFSVGYALMAPDGVEKQMIVVNNQFPGPTIEANWGDWIEVEVQNNLDEGTAFHWHGLFQEGTPWADGVPGVSQCPIAPGQRFTYRFRANSFGSSWYHSHYSAQYSMGPFGSLVIHGPQHIDYDIDIGPVLLSDWYHQDYHDLVKAVIGTELATVIGATVSDNILINGRNSFNCSVALKGQKCTPNAPLSHFSFKTGKTHLLRVVNGGSDGMLYFSIDDHKLQVVALDFVPIVPYTTNVITLGVGQRMDILVEGIGSSAGSYYMRAVNSLGPGCDQSFAPPPANSALAIVHYQHASPDQLPDSTAAPFIDTCSDAPITEAKPYRASPVVTQDIHTVNIEITTGSNSSGTLLWFENNSTFFTDFNDPVLRDVGKGQISFPDKYNVYDTENAKYVRFVIVNNSPATHPMHMHGHSYQVLANVPNITWDGQITDPSNPLRRDTQIVGPMSTIVLQIESNNAGVWPLHCHIAWHVSAGLYVQFIEQRDSIKRLAPEQHINDNCKVWDEWSQTHSVFQIDSGLRRMMIKRSENE